MEYIYLTNKRILKKKTGLFIENDNKSGQVVIAGIEPATQGFSILCSTN